MKKIVKIMSMLLVALMSVCTVSCASEKAQIPQGAIEVICPSNNVTYVEQGEYPMHLFGDAETLKWGYNVYVSRLNAAEKLVLSTNRNEGLGRTSMTESGRYFKCGEWVGYCDGVFLGSEKLLSEECVGMVASAHDADSILIITNTEDNSYVYGAKLSDGVWTLDKEGRIELGSVSKFIYYYWPVYPSKTHSPSEKMYIITENTLTVLSVGDYLDEVNSDFSNVEKNELDVPEYWSCLSPTSAVEIDGKIYFGDRFGVVMLNGSEFSYYPVTLAAMR